jgi:hypothetical protein
VARDSVNVAVEKKDWTAFHFIFLGPSCNFTGLLWCCFSSQGPLCNYAHRLMELLGPSEPSMFKKKTMCDDAIFVKEHVFGQLGYLRDSRLLLYIEGFTRKS